MSKNKAAQEAARSFFGNEKYELESTISGQVNQTYVIKKETEPIGILRETKKSAKNIYFEGKVIDSLVERNFPTPAMLRSKNGTKFFEAEEKKYQAFEYVQGRKLSEKEITHTQLNEIGKSIGNMHEILYDLNFSEEPEFTEFGRFSNINQRLRWKDYIQEEILEKFKILSDSNGRSILNRSRKTLDHSIQELDAMYTNLPKQPIHADYTRDNLFFDQSLSKIAGVIDFDDSHVDSRIFDPVVASFYFSIKDTRFSLQQATHLLKSYKSEMKNSLPLKEEEIRAIPKLTQMYALFATLRMISQFNKNPNYSTLLQVQEYDAILQSTQTISQKEWEEIY